MKVLLWLHLAYRPLKLHELQHALAVEQGDTQFEVDNIPSRKAILDCCLGLVLVDEETMTVRFVHYSLQEYFRLQSGIHFPYGHSAIAETCLLFLNFPEIREHCKSMVEVQKRLRDFPLLEYAACNWGTYTKHQSSETVVKLAIMLAGGENKLPSASVQVLYGSITDSWRFKYWESNADSVVLQFSGIHVGALFGLDYLTKYYCEIGQADLRDDTGRTPLSWAAARGHEAVVQLLIERNDVDVNAKANDGRTPLSWAARNGHGAVVRLLIERNDVDVNAKDSGYGQTPLLWAARSGHEAVVRLLIERSDVDVNATNNMGRTPLSWAVQEGYESVVRLLLEQDNINLDVKDNQDRTALDWATNNHTSIIQLLRLAAAHPEELDAQGS